MRFRKSLAKAIINKLLNDLSYEVYLQEAADGATAPYIVYSMITDGNKNYAFDESEAVTTQPMIQLDLWDNNTPASGTTEDILDEIDESLDQTKIEDEGLEFTLFNSGNFTRDYQDESGMWHSWLRYRLQIS